MRDTRLSAVPIREIFSGALVLVAAATLVVNFVLAIPVTLAALITSGVSAATAKNRRVLLVTFAVVAGGLLVAAVLMSVFLLADGAEVIDSTTVPNTGPG